MSFHKVVQLLPRLYKEATDEENFLSLVADKFKSDLAEQELQKQGQPREQWIEIDENRVSQGLHSAISEAHRYLSDHPGHGRARLDEPSRGRTIGSDALVEYRLISKDGLISGVLDRVTRDSVGVIITDYKSASRNDVPERYERQLQTYAWLWNEVFDEWPVRAVLVYPFVGQSRDVNIDPARCSEIVLEAVDNFIRLLSKDIEQLGAPGEVCKICDYKPWCRPFWRAQSQLSPLDRQVAQLGFEARLESLKYIDDLCVAQLKWNSTPVKLVFAPERFPQLSSERNGSRIRVLDAKLSGTSAELRLGISGGTEIFILTD